jgi:hypothetical protein
MNDAQFCNVCGGVLLLECFSGWYELYCSSCGYFFMR